MAAKGIKPFSYLIHKKVLMYDVFSSTRSIHQKNERKGKFWQVSMLQVSKNMMFIVIASKISTNMQLGQMS